MADGTHLARLRQGMAIWSRWWKERGIVLRQRCASLFQRAWGTVVPAGRQGLQTIEETGWKTFTRLRAMTWQAIASQHWRLRQAIASRHWRLHLLIVAVIMVGIIWKVPQWQAASWEGLEPKDLPKLQNDARTTLVQAFGGAVLLIGLYFTLRNLQLTQDKQITEHYTRAVEHLGSEKLEVRLGAIYALERIARDSERDHWPIMEILTAYVRKHAPWKEPEQRLQSEVSPGDEQSTQSNPSWRKPATDIQAILTVLGRRTRTYGKGEDQRLNLANTDLRGADLNSAHLESANLRGAHLERANLQGAPLAWADLSDAHLEGAVLAGTNLAWADLRGAHLRGVIELDVEQLAMTL